MGVRGSLGRSLISRPDIDDRLIHVLPYDPWTQCHVIYHRGDEGNLNDRRATMGGNEGKFSASSRESNLQPCFPVVLCVLSLSSLGTLYMTENPQGGEREKKKGKKKKSQR
ncbi:hypothetical protein BaRGS_00039219 [Batillaria attramentaria]|uniref:Uncharacterized protein n=1 Tax=Batillaria attramentaria TaxID=370345 RepID=A0ABD0J3L1_9CAEN